MRIRWSFIVTVIGLFYLSMGLLALSIWAITPAATTKPVVHTYNYVDAAGTKSSWEGESIRSNGVCIEITLHGRLDTILCPGGAITEAVEEQPSNPGAPVNPDSIIPLPPGPPHRQAGS